jgi:dephospho-CoA kinase
MAVNNDMLVIAITGGIGSGKSVAAGIISEAGYPVINTDDRAKELMVEDDKVREKLIAEFGDYIYNDDGTLNKSFLASKVFGDSSKSRRALDRLNRIVHPAVIDDMIEKLDRLHEERQRMVFVESALVFESGINEGFDYIIVIDAPEEIRLDRIEQRGGISREDARSRMEDQMSTEEKIRRADFTIDNSGSMDDLRSAVNSLLEILKNLPPKDFSEFGGFIDKK